MNRSLDTLGQSSPTLSRLNQRRINLQAFRRLDRCLFQHVDLAIPDARSDRIQRAQTTVGIIRRGQTAIG